MSYDPNAGYRQEEQQDQVSTPRQPGAVTATGRSARKSPLGWLPWVALLLLGLVALGALLVARNVGDAGDDPGVDLVDDPSGKGADPPGPDANSDEGGAPALTFRVDAAGAVAALR